MAADAALSGMTLLPGDEYVIEFTNGEIIVRNLTSAITNGWSGLMGEPAGRSSWSTPQGVILFRTHMEPLAEELAQVIRDEMPDGFHGSDWPAERWQRAHEKFMERLTQRADECRERMRQDERRQAACV